MKFIDETMIRTQAGNGGDGIATFKTAKGQPKMGADGGDGGNGGNVILVGNCQINTLSKLRYKQWYRADHGVKGGTSAKTGACGEHKLIEVPLGTEIFDSDSGELIGEILTDGQKLVIAKGGKRGLGNIHWVRSTRQQPRQFSEGEPGGARDIRLELKLIADIGLAGFPNAGKSTLLSRVSAARPKIADYAFTTLEPNLGVVDGSMLGEFWDRSVVIADIPGLIEGASDGKGLGIQFLRHLERTRAIVYVLDAFDTYVTPTFGYEKLQAELAAYDPQLVEKPSIIVLNKFDLLPNQSERDAIIEEAKLLEGEVFAISAVSGEGIKELMVRLHELAVEAAADENPVVEDHGLVLDPLPDFGPGLAPKTSLTEARTP